MADRTRSAGRDVGALVTIPVALFAYARPNHLQRTLDCLRANRIPRLYVFSDGPKTPELSSRVDAVRQILRTIDWCDVSIVERRENLGLGRSIRTGVSEVLALHESVLVFEDDLVCVDGTYAYLTAALEHYKNDPRVMSVTGWTHPRITPEGLSDDPYFDGRAECLVWGSWRRTWAGMDEDALTLLRRCEQRGIDPYAYGADLVAMAQTEHQRNIWAVRFLYLHLLHGGLCLRPPHSLVEHIGFDNEATNAADGAEEWSNPPLRPAPPLPIAWPEPIEHPDCRPLALAAFGSRPTYVEHGPQWRAHVRSVLPTATRIWRRLFASPL
jgi:hypothetical protein